MVTGSQTLQTIERSIRELGEQEANLRADLEKANSEHVTQLEKRTKAFREFAAVRARHALADGIIDRADQLQYQVETVLAARQKTIAALKDRNSEAERRRISLIQDADLARSEVADLELRLDSAASTAKQQLASEPDHVALIKAREDTQRTFEKADAKTKLAEADFANKGKAYEADPLFMYLWRRKFGSSDYNANSIIRMGDQFVARIVRYHEARANYAILGEIPARLREHRDRLGKAARDAYEIVSAREADRIKVIAGADLLAMIGAARDHQSKIDSELGKVEAEILEVGAQLTRYGEGQDDSLKQAVAMLARFLEQENYRELLALARQTDEPTDDQIVERIGDIDQDISLLERAIEAQRRDLLAATRRRAELLEAASRIRRSRYDDPGSTYGPDDVAGDLLRELIRGAITAAEYWQRSRRRHGWDDRPADPFRRGSGMPPFGGGGGGGWDRRVDGDDFRTGGGF